jgi:hypothetical protein
MTKQEIQKQIDDLTYNNNIRVSQQDINEANQNHAIAVATNQIAIAKNQLGDFERQRKIDDDSFSLKLSELQNELEKSVE